MKLSDELTWRGFVNQTTLKSLDELDKQKFTLYFGVDPSSDSMTIGNLAAAVMVRHFLNYGHKVVLLVGGATGMIGDPGGKDEERNLLTLEQVASNKKGLASQFKRLFAGNDFRLVDNYDWLSKVGLLEFLRDVGKHYSMSNLVQRDFIASRMGEGGSGISYTEFSYTLLQGYDFYYLNQKYGVNLQVCGSDQWGNSISGVELIRRKTAQEVHVYSCPLVINKSTGVKFGKTEGGAVWLDPLKTSVYQFYQFWLNVDDEGAGDYLKYFTLLSKEEIEKVLSDFAKNPAKRLAQKTLAYEVTALVHGKERADAVRKISEILFGTGNYNELTKSDFELLKKELTLAKTKIGANLTDLLVETNLAKSKGEARQFLAGNAIYINGQQIPLSKETITSDDLIHKHLILRRGKNSLAILSFS
jgi:tyrosyl-tRNA synthetase